MHSQSKRWIRCLIVVGAVAASPGLSQAPLAQQKPLATDEHQAGGVRVELLEVKRTPAETVTVRWRYVNTTQEAKAVSVGANSRDNHYRIADQVYLVDNVNRKKHLVVHDAEDRPLAANHEINREELIMVGGRQTLNSWARFPAPPADVTKISVVIPGVPPFEDVPISQ